MNIEPIAGPWVILALILIGVLVWMALRPDKDKE